MSKFADWKGILPIISIPFTQDGAIDYTGFLRTLEYIDQTDAFGMVLFGIASEFYKLSDFEKECLVRIYASFPTEKKKIASVTNHATFLAQRRARLYQDLGLDGLMLLPPFFLSPSKENIQAHIQMVVSAVQIPVILQVAAKETAVSYTSAELFALYQQFPHLILKIEGSPFPQSNIKKLRDSSKDIPIFNGYAGRHMIEALKSGCNGIMPGSSFIKVYSQIYRDYFNDVQAAQNRHHKLLKYIDKWMSSCEYIISIEKYILLKAKVIASDHCRKPNYQLSHKDLAEIEDFQSEFFI